MIRFEREFKLDDCGLLAYSRNLDKFKNMFEDEAYFGSKIDLWHGGRVTMTIVLKRRLKRNERVLLLNGFKEGGYINKRAAENLIKEVPVTKLEQLYKRMNDKDYAYNIIDEVLNEELFGI